MKKKEFESIFGDIKLTDREYMHGKNGKGTKMGINAGCGYKNRNVRVSLGKQFHDPAYALAAAFNEEMKRIASFQPVKAIDPKDVTSENVTVDYVRGRRALAATIARKYYSFGTMRKYASWCRTGRPLTMYQCAIIINYGKNIRAWLKKRETDGS